MNHQPEWRPDGLPTTVARIELSGDSFEVFPVSLLAKDIQLETEGQFGFREHRW